jgi:hypothetical protein
MSLDASPLQTHDNAPSRRTLLRAGAHAAWMIPAVQVVSQVPALAASGDGLSITAATWSGGAAKLKDKKAHTPFHPHVTIQNNDVDPAQNLMVTIRIHSNGGNIGTSAFGGQGVLSNSPAGWTLADINNKGTKNVDLIYLATAPLAAGSSIDLDPTITINYPPLNSVMSMSVFVTSSTYGAIGSSLTKV